MEEKYCKFCDKTKPLTEFAKKGKRNASKCKACHNLYQKEYYNKNSARVKHNVRQHKRAVENKIAILCKRYNITLEEYEHLLTRSGGICEICKVKPYRDIDHCHKTGKVRGLLCGTCNRAIGMLGDSVDILQASVIYLSRT